MTAAHDKVTVVIPAYNEAATIADVARRARAQLPQVIVVDDGSTDGTADCLQGLDVTVLRNAENLGKAVSLWRGMQAAMAAGASAVITLDADGQHQPEDIPLVLRAAGQHPGELIVASRLRRAETPPPPLRLFANRCANFWISWAAGYRIADTQSGFRLYPVVLLKRLSAPRGRGSCFVFESETLIEAAWQGVRSRPVVIDAVYPKVARPSHYRPAVDTLRIIRMVALRLLRRGMYPLGLWRVLRETQPEPLPDARPH
jgi:glycosyltransferase involved in cell wall biosynthesis